MSLIRDFLFVDLRKKLFSFIQNKTKSRIILKIKRINKLKKRKKKEKEHLLTNNHFLSKENDKRSEANQLIKPLPNQPAWKRPQGSHDLKPRSVFI